MENHDARSRRERAVFRLAYGSALLSALMVVGFIAAQAYVRWSLNQNFTFLGGGELEVLTGATAGIIIGLAFIYRSRS